VDQTSDLLAGESEVSEPMNESQALFIGTAIDAMTARIAFGLRQQADFFVKWIDGALQRVRSPSAQLVSPCTLGICHCKIGLDPHVTWRATMGNRVSGSKGTERTRMGKVND
jgi:hypothetical protein